MLRAAAILTRDRLLPPLGPYLGGQAPVPWNLVSSTPLFLKLGFCLLWWGQEAASPFTTPIPSTVSLS